MANYIDGKLVGNDVSAGQVIYWGQSRDGEVTVAPGVTFSAEKLHDLAGCHVRAFYFCPHCAREALTGVDVSDPSGWSEYEP